ncbi:MAG: hypothetical protein GY859_00530, partial [Desulfobacterales bacterium]|nr:hypothetical protein [Desulfobacterales bacterium]
MSLWDFASYYKETYFDPAVRLWGLVWDYLGDTVEKVGCSVNTTTMEYNDRAVDLAVKAPGGWILEERIFYNGEWHWEHDRKLTFKKEWTGEICKACGEGSDGVVPVGCNSFYSTYIMKRDVVMYKNHGQLKRYETDDVCDTVEPACMPSIGYGDSTGLYGIAPTDEGYRWKNVKSGEWELYSMGDVYGVEYWEERTCSAAIQAFLGHPGKLLSWGDRNGMIGQIVYDNDEQFVHGRAAGVADRNGRQVIWYEYNDTGGLTAVRDFTGRRVEYQLNGDDLTVLDAAGKTTEYRRGKENQLDTYVTIDAAGRETKALTVGNVTMKVLDGDDKGHAFKYFIDKPENEFHTRIEYSSGRVKEVFYNLHNGNTKRVEMNGRVV